MSEAKLRAMLKKPLAIHPDYLGIIVDADDAKVASCLQGIHDFDVERAEQLVHESNCHDALLAACLEMHRTLTSPSRIVLDSTRLELAPWLPMLKAAISAAQPEPAKEAT